MHSYKAPLSEKTESELVLAIAIRQSDSHRCRAELARRGWSPVQIDERIMANKRSRPCEHPLSCRKCRVQESACGEHRAGIRGHENCTGENV